MLIVANPNTSHRQSWYRLTLSLSQTELVQAKQIKCNKQQYDLIAQIIKQYPSRDDTKAAISKVCYSPRYDMVKVV